MTSIRELKRDIEIVRRALNLDSEAEAIRVRAEEITRCLQEQQRLIEEAAAMLTEADARELQDEVNREFTSNPLVDGFDEAIHHAVIHDVLSEYHRRKQEQL